MATIELPNGVSTFHSHPSGTIAENGSGNIFEESRVHFFEQSPSKLDIENAEGFTHYVFGRGNNTVYIYNSLRCPDSNIHEKILFFYYPLPTYM